MADRKRGLLLLPVQQCTQSLSEPDIGEHYYRVNRKQGYAILASMHVEFRKENDMNKFIFMLHFFINLYYHSHGNDYKLSAHLLNKWDI